MGCYINPPDMSKEEFLESFGELVKTPPKPNEVLPDKLPVCLVNNGAFSAAAVAFCLSEWKEFMDASDTRPKQWYIVPVSDIKEVSNLHNYL